METNKIYLGDAYELIKQVPSKSVDLIVTDPPYEIGNLTTKAHGLFAKNGQTRKYEREMLEKGSDCRRPVRRKRFNSYCLREIRSEMLHDGTRPKILRRHNKKMGDIDRQESRGARIDTGETPRFFQGREPEMAPSFSHRFLTL